MDIGAQSDVVSISSPDSEAPDADVSEISAAPAVPLDAFEITIDEALGLLTPDGETVTVGSPRQLAALAVLVNSGDGEYKGKTFILQNDINLYGYDFTPIGGFNADNKGFMFEAVFDGDDYIISGLTVRDNFFEEGTGLFGVIGPGGEVKNVHITGGNVRGRYNAGGIAGRSAGIMSNCSFRGVVYAEREGAGGLAGSVVFLDSPSIITACFANAEVSAHKSAGAFAGRAGFGTEVKDCYALGSVTAVKVPEGGDATAIGGFIGSASGAEISCCYSNTEVYTNVPAALVGGFAGYSDGEFSSCYYNHTATSNWKPVGNKAEDGDETGVTPCETLELCDADTFAGWDFIIIWDISETRNRGLPFLR